MGAGMKAVLVETFPWTYANLAGFTLHTEETQHKGLFVVDRDDFEASFAKELHRYQTEFRWCTKEDGKTVCHVGAWADVDGAEVKQAVLEALA